MLRYELQKPCSSSIHSLVLNYASSLLGLDSGLAGSLANI
jgi:hypothetical protein